MKHLLQNIVFVSALLLLYWGVGETFAIKSINTDVTNDLHLDLAIELPSYPHANPKKEETSGENSESENSENDSEIDFSSSQNLFYFLSKQNIISRNCAFQNLQFILSRKSIYLFNCAFRL